MKITVFGAGYVGLVSATGFAEIGHSVRVIDVNEARVSDLGAGKIPFYEPGLPDLVHRNLKSERLSFRTEVGEDFADSEIFFICVGTPASKDGRADLTAIFDAARAIARTAKRPAIVAIKSTVPAGTCYAVEVLVGSGLEVVSNPEFLKEGSALADFFKPDRVVLGTKNEDARELLRRLYAPLQLSGERVLFTDRCSSELIKYASNAMLAMRVSFMNELSRLCAHMGADIRDVRLGVGADSRIGKAFLYAGPGYGGSCFPKDVQALVHLGQEHGVPMRVAEAAHLANAEQVAFVGQLVLGALGRDPGKEPGRKKVALWGLAFKPETDDVRESPALAISKYLLDAGVVVAAHDPEASSNFARALEHPRLRIVENPYDAADGAHGLVLLTEWRSYRAPDFAALKRRMHGDVITDARNVWKRAEVERAGFRYQGIGTR